MSRKFTATKFGIWPRSWRHCSARLPSTSGVLTCWALVTSGGEAGQPVVEQEQRRVGGAAVGRAGERLDRRERVRRLLGDLEAVHQPGCVGARRRPPRSSRPGARPERIISRSVGHGSPATGVVDVAAQAGGLDGGGEVGGSTWSSTNRVRTSSGLVASQPRTSPSRSGNGVDPVSHSPWQRNSASGPVGLRRRSTRRSRRGRHDLGSELGLGDGQRLVVAAGRRCGRPSRPGTPDHTSTSRARTPCSSCPGIGSSLLGQEPAGRTGDRHRVVGGGVGDLVEAALAQLGVAVADLPLAGHRALLRRVAARAGAARRPGRPDDQAERDDQSTGHEDAGAGAPPGAGAGRLDASARRSLRADRQTTDLVDQRLHAHGHQHDAPDAAATVRTPRGSTSSRPPTTIRAIARPAAAQPVSGRVAQRQSAATALPNATGRGDGPRPEHQQPGGEAERPDRPPQRRGRARTTRPPRNAPVTVDSSAVRISAPTTTSRTASTAATTRKVTATLPAATPIGRRPDRQREARQRRQRRDDGGHSRKRASLIVSSAKPWLPMLASVIATDSAVGRRGRGGVGRGRGPGATSGAARGRTRRPPRGRPGGGPADRNPTVVNAACSWAAATRTGPVTSLLASSERETLSTSGATATRSGRARSTCAVSSSASASFTAGRCTMPTTAELKRSLSSRRRLAYPRSWPRTAARRPARGPRGRVGSDRRTPRARAAPDGVSVEVTGGILPSGACPGPMQRRPCLWRRRAGRGRPARPGADTFRPVSDAVEPSDVLWLATTRPDGRPHLTPIWYRLVDGRFWMCATAGAVKVRNLEANPACSVAVEEGLAGRSWPKGVPACHQPGGRPVPAAGRGGVPGPLRLGHRHGPRRLHATHRGRGRPWLYGGMPASS